MEASHVILKASRDVLRGGHAGRGWMAARGSNPNYTTAFFLPTSGTKQTLAVGVW